jgi:hypothetical protein
MHAGAMMRRVLKFMGDGAAGRHRQEDHDGKGDDPGNVAETATSHKKVPVLAGMLTNWPTKRQRNFSPAAIFPTTGRPRR